MMWHGKAGSCHGTYTARVLIDFTLLWMVASAILMSMIMRGVSMLPASWFSEGCGLLATLPTCTLGTWLTYSHNHTLHHEMMTKYARGAVSSIVISFPCWLAVERLTSSSISWLEMMGRRKLLLQPASSPSKLHTLALLCYHWLHKPYLDHITWQSSPDQVIRRITPLFVTLLTAHIHGDLLWHLTFQFPRPT